MARAPRRLRNHARILVAGGWSFVLLAILFPLLSYSFSHASGLAGDDAYMLEQLAAVGALERGVFLLMSFVPALLVAGAIACYSALRVHAPLLSGAALIALSLSSLCFFMGIARWYVFYFSLGDAMTDGDLTGQDVAAFIRALDGVLGFVVGQLWAEVLLYAGIFLLGVALHAAVRFPVWLSYLALAVAVLGFVGVGRHSSALGGVVFDVFNAVSLAPLFFIAMGVGLLRFKQKKVRKKLSPRKPYYKTRQQEGCE